MLSKSEIKILSYLSGISDKGVTLSEASEKLGWSSGHTSRVVSGLEDRGLVQSTREGQNRLISGSDTQPVEQLGNLTEEFSHVDFADLISGSTLSILYYLDQGRTARDLSTLSGVSKNTIYRRLNKLQDVGIVRKNHSKYLLTDDFLALSDLARSIAHHEHRHEALDLTENVNILWERHDEYLFSCTMPIVGERFHATGPSEFENFGIPLLTRDRRHYFRSTNLSELTSADLVCHTLLIDSTTRYRSYCMLLIEAQQIDPSKLYDRAEHYEPEAPIEITALVEELPEYLDTSGEISSEMLPEWEEFKSTAADYDISV